MFTHDSYAGVYLKNHHLHHFSKIGSQLEHGAARSLASPYTKHAPTSFRHIEAVTSYPQIEMSSLGLTQVGLPQIASAQYMSPLLTTLQDASALFTPTLAKQSYEQSQILQAVQAYASVSMLQTLATTTTLFNQPWSSNLLPAQSYPVAALTSAQTSTLAISQSAQELDAPADTAQPAALNKLTKLAVGTSAFIAAANTTSQAYPNVSVCFTSADNKTSLHQPTTVASQESAPLQVPYLASGHLLSPSFYNPQQMQARSSLDMAPAILAHMVGSFKKRSLHNALLAKLSLVGAALTDLETAAGSKKSTLDFAGGCPTKTVWQFNQDTSAYASKLATSLHGVRSLSVTYAVKPLWASPVHDLKLAHLCRLLGASYPNEDPKLDPHMVAVDLQTFTQTKTTAIPSSC